MANNWMIKDLEEAIKFGWRLATVNEMNPEFVKFVKEKGKGEKNIFLSNGSWDLEAESASQHKMKVLAFVTGEPKFRILSLPKDSKEIGKQGWRVACVAEVARYQDKVIDLCKKNCPNERVLLSDGWTDEDGSNEREKTRNANRVLLIETPFERDTGASSSVKWKTISERNATKK